jgi:ketosteroid isomerase-like protein
MLAWRGRPSPAANQATADSQIPRMITLSPGMPKLFAAAAAQETPMKKITIALLILLTAISVVAGEKKLPTGSDVLIQLEADFAAAVAKHGHDAFFTYFAEDGVELDDGGGINTREAMRKQPPWPEGTILTWTPVKAEMAASGDLGYTYGNYVFTAKNKEGKLVSSYGKYTSIWKKQKDGQWKVVVDIGNSSPDPKAK